MKKTILYNFFAVILVLLCFLFVGCDSENETQGSTTSEKNNSSTSCSHTWKNATCQTPKKCSKCGVTEGGTVDHKFVNNECDYCGLKDEKEIQFAAASKVYGLLNTSGESCEEIMDSIYGAWHFSIYKADDYSSGSSCLLAFVSATGLDYSGANNSLNKILTAMNLDSSDISKLVALRNYSMTVAVVIDYYTQNGLYGNIEKDLEIAKTELKKVTNEYADYTEYPALKEYFTNVSAYFEFCKSPTGSFAQLKTTVDNYETDIRNSKADLGFIFE